MLKQRIVTALILAVVFIGSILFASHDKVIILFAAMLGVSLFELSNLTLKPGAFGSIILGIMATVLFWWFSGDMEIQFVEYLAMIGSILWIGIALLLVIYQFSGNWALLTRIIYFLLGLLLLWICTTALVFLHGHFTQGGWILLYLMTLVWIADIGAYFSGRRFGKNKLAPGISPGKTWEGVIGGVIANLIWMMLIFSLTDLLEMSLLWFVGIGLATSAISVVGDLFESILKREAGVKDSGKILPGHGGVLDRFDSVIAAAPVFVTGIFLAGLV